MVSEQTDTAASADVPLAQVYLTLRDRWLESGGAVAEGPAGGEVLPLVARLCRRLGSVPKTWPERRAREAAADMLQQVAEQTGSPPQEVGAVFSAFCADDGPDAHCGAAPRCAECPVGPCCDYPDRRPTIKDLPEADRPRERLLSGGEDRLSDIELLAIIIRSGSQEATALELAGRLLSRFASFRRLARSSTGELTQVRGIGPAKAAQIKAALAIARRYAAEEMPVRTAVQSTEQLYRYMREKLSGRQKEHFVVLLLDTKHRIIREESIAIGSLNESVVHPREVFREAVRESAARVIFVHNHPSGNPQPSPQDRQLTARLCEVGRLMGIPVLDHLIVGDEGYFSFAEAGLLGAK